MLIYIKIKLYQIMIYQRLVQKVTIWTLALRQGIFVAYSLLDESFYAVLLTEGVSERNNRIRARNELCRFRSDIPRS